LVDLHRLTPEERALYDDLRDNRIRAKLRLEQEHTLMATQIPPLMATSNSPTLMVV
jgi:hypothetical protein